MWVPVEFNLQVGRFRPLRSLRIVYENIGRIRAIIYLF